MSDVLTLRLDERSQAHFEDLRRRHFPPERNKIPAHLTLFHQLPEVIEVEEALEREARGMRRFRLAVTGVRSLGRGVAYTLSSGALAELHRRLAAEFAEYLSPQDRQRFSPHIVVQNKVEPGEARKLLLELQGTFVASEAKAVGLDLWHYRGGPWELARTFAFAAEG